MEIEIYVDGERHGMRQWSAVPRIGEKILVDFPKLSARAMLMIDDVEWSSSNSGSGEAVARLYCKYR